MKITVIIEKGSDGYYSCYSVEDIPHFSLAGFGDTAAEAKEDFYACYEDIKELEAEAGRTAPELQFTFKYDIASFFSYFSFLNISKVAERAGINPSLMRQYTSGAANAGEKQYQRLREAVQSLSAELAAATF